MSSKARVSFSSQHEFSRSSRIHVHHEKLDHQASKPVKNAHLCYPELPRSTPTIAPTCATTIHHSFGNATYSSQAGRPSPPLLHPTSTMIGKVVVVLPRPPLGGGSSSRSASIRQHTHTHAHAHTRTQASAPLSSWSLHPRTQPD